MTKQKSLLIAMTGASLLATSRTQAQSFGYAADDLLLNFRNTASITAEDLEVNLGPVSAIAALNGMQVVVPASLVQGVYATPSASTPIGFSAFAADASGTTGAIWLTRVDSTPGFTPTNNLPGQQVFNAQNLVAARIANIGNGANEGTIVAQGQATVPGATSGDSYQAQGEQSSAEEAQFIINFGGDENVAVSKGGNIESVQSGSSSVYEALWEVPVTGTPATYLGYFTFNTSGEVDYTSALGSVTPPPSVMLTIASSAPNSVTIQWPAGNYTLQQNTDIGATAGWATSGYSVSTTNGTSSVTVTPLMGNLFFRLANQ